MASIKKRPDGSWRARYRDEAGKEHARHFTRKVDGQRWLDEVTAAVVTGTYVDPRAGRITLADYYASWSARQVWAPLTTTSSALALRDSGLGSMPLGSIRRSHVESWIKAMTTRGLAPSTISTRFGYFRAVLTAAVKDKVIASDPSEGVTLPRQRRRAATMVIPTPPEVGRLVAAAAPWFAPAVALAAFAGLRLGELCGLQVGDVAFLARTLDVRRQVQRAGGGSGSVVAPKHGSERTVHLPDELVTLLGQHVGEHCPGTDPARWLITGESGRSLNPDTARHAWEATRNAAGLPGYRLHDLRHHFASGLIAAGCDVVTVQRALGHASPSVTLDCYSHLWPTAEDRTRQAAAGLMSAAIAPADSLRTSDGQQGR